MRRTKPPGAYSGREDAFQKSAIAMVRSIAHPLGVDPRAIMHVPNGGQRNAIVAAKLKAQGTVAGYPDIMVFHHHFTGERGWCSGIALELKIFPNKPSEAQEAIHDLLRKAGWSVVVCYGLGEVENAVKAYLG